MNQNKTEGDAPRGEDYGGPADYDNTNADNSSATDSGKYSGGTTGTRQGSSEGEQFGEFGDTGTGTDLTIEMEGSDARSGMIKGGQSGADDAAGPGQYGGKTGGLNNS